MKKLLILVILAGSSTIAQAQESWLNILRSDVRTQVQVLLQAAMEFSDEEAEVFWPIYREYELESSKLADQRLEGIKDFAANFETMTDEKADELVKQSQKLVKKRHDLNKKYYGKVRKVLTGVRAARFYQVNRQIQSLIDLQIQSELPLIEEGMMAPAEEDSGME
jgi:hypothetical protein